MALWNKPSAAAGAGIGRIGLGPLGLMLLPTLVVAVVHWSWSAPAWAGDYAQYLSHARAIVEGRPYDDIGYIYNPAAWVIGPPAYPPGLPLTLAPLVALVGVDSMLFRLFNLVALGMFAWFAFRRLVHDIAPHQAAIGAGFAALSIEVQMGTLVPITDLPFAALLWALILAADRDEGWRWSRVAIVTAIGFALFAYRVAAIAIVPALGLFALLRWRTHRGRSLVPVVAWGLAGVGALLSGLVRNPYADSVSSGLRPLDQQLDVLRSNYRLGLFEAELYPFGLDRWDDVYHVIASVLVLLGGALLGWRLRRSFLFLFTFSYLAMLALSPVAELRYAWPIFPLIGAALAMGLERLLPRALPSHRTITLAVCLAIMLGAMRHALSVSEPFAIHGTRDGEALEEWLARRHRSEPMRLMFHNPRVLTLHTRVPAMGLTPRSTPGHLVAMEENRISHLVTQPDTLSSCLQRLANRLPATYPERFERVYANATFQVHRLVPAETPFDAPYDDVFRNGDARWCGPSSYGPS